MSALTAGLTILLVLLIIGTVIFLIISRKKKNNPQAQIHPQIQQQMQQYQQQNPQQYQQPMQQYQQPMQQYQQPMQQAVSQPIQQHIQQQPQFFQQDGQPYTPHDTYSNLQEKLWTISVMLQKTGIVVSTAEQKKIEEQVMKVIQDSIKKMNSNFKKAKIDTSIVLSSDGQ